MGLGLGFLRDLNELKRSGALDRLKRVADIGAQQLTDVFLTAPELEEAYGLFGCARPPGLVPVGPDKFCELAPPARLFWNALKISYVAIDLDGDAIRLDLDRGEVPPRIRGAFDLVVNSGTTEHVANQSNAFRVIHDLTRKGGIMYHEVPAGGLIDHGFVSYQPKFFHRIAQQNAYEVLFIRLSASPPPSPVPAEYLIDPNYRVPASVVDMMLRVALRKRHNSAFSSPVDAAPHLIPPPRLPWPHRLRLRLGRIKRAVGRATRP
jgi:SAM-dependent methyltransferase